MKPIPFSVRGWAAFSETCQNQEDWYQWASSPCAPEVKEGVSPDLRFLNLMQRRRLNGPAKMVFWLAKQLEAYPLQDYPWVFSSRHGDSPESNVVLERIGCESEISPAAFSASVHNSVMGQISIHFKNKKTYQCLAGGHQSFAAGLLEAMAQMTADGAPVVFVYVETDLNPRFQVDIQEVYPPHGLILLIVPPASELSIHEITLKKGDGLTSPLNIPALDFLAAFLNSEQKGLTLQDLQLSFGN